MQTISPDRLQRWRGGSWPWRVAVLRRKLRERGSSHDGAAGLVEHFEREVMAKGSYRADYFTPNIPSWARWLEPYRSQERVVALEIGSFQGLSAVFLLDHLFATAGGELLCIDPFATRKPTEPPFEAVFDANVGAVEAGRGIVRKRKGLSHDVLLQLRDEGYGGKVDVAYVDGSHTAIDTLADAALTWPLVRSGGLMIFDDYTWHLEDARLERPQAAIDAFVSVVRDDVEWVERGRQLALRKR